MRCSSVSYSGVRAKRILRVSTFLGGGGGTISGWNARIAQRIKHKERYVNRPTIGLPDRHWQVFIRLGLVGRVLNRPGD